MAGGPALAERFQHSCKLKGEHLAKEVYFALGFRYSRDRQITVCYDGANIDELAEWFQALTWAQS